MAISGIADPISGTTITSAFAVTNYGDPLREHIALLGSGVPPATAGKLLITSDGTHGTWLAPGAEGSFLEIISGIPAYLVPTIVDTSAPSVDSNSVPALLSNLANRITAITGIANWKSAPGSTIAALITSIAAKLPLVGGTLTGDLAVTRSATGQPTQGVVYLGEAANGHWIAVLDGTNLVYSNNKIWHEGNDGPTSGLAAQTAATATLLNGNDWLTPLDTFDTTVQSLTTTQVGVAGLQVAATRTGKWLVAGKTHIAAKTGDANCRMALFANNSQISSAIIDPKALTFDITISTVAIATITAVGQLFEIRVNKDSGAAASQYLSGHLSATWISP